MANKLCHMVYDQAIADNAYKNLQNELSKPNPNIENVLFLTGAVHALRLTIGYQVPEIENAFLFIREKIGRGDMECLMQFMHSMPQENSIL